MDVNEREYEHGIRVYSRPFAVKKLGSGCHAELW